MNASCSKFKLLNVASACRRQSHVSPGIAHMILIVEDEKDFAHSLERFLRFTGLDAVAVNTSGEALDLVNTRKPSLIILDLTLPDIDGMTLLRAIRKDA